MIAKARWRKLTAEQREELVLRAGLAARIGHSIDANPYDPDTQRESWAVWRFAFSDGAREVRRSASPKGPKAAGESALDALTSCFDIKGFAPAK